MRVAVYWVPERDHPLWQAGCSWLGRDPESGATFPLPSGVDADVVAEAARYGFHATLKAPFATLGGIEALEAAATLLAGSIEPFALRLEVAELHGFLAIRESQPSEALDRLGAACVRDLDRFRAPLSESELARRRRSPLTPAQDGLLVRWGYPYVLEEWRFHLTLSKRLDASKATPLRRRAEAWFGPALAETVPFTGIALFEEHAPGAPFRLVRRITLGT